MFDATCQRIREVAEQNQLPLPDALRPSAVPGTKTYHVNMSGGWLRGWWREGGQGGQGFFY